MSDTAFSAEVLDTRLYSAVSMAEVGDSIDTNLAVQVLSIYGDAMHPRCLLQIMFFAPCLLGAPVVDRAVCEISRIQWIPD